MKKRLESFDYLHSMWCCYCMFGEHVMVLEKWKKNNGKFMGKYQRKRMGEFSFKFISKKIFDSYFFYTYFHFAFSYFSIRNSDKELKISISPSSRFASFLFLEQNNKCTEASMKQLRDVCIYCWKRSVFKQLGPVSNGKYKASMTY